MRIEIFTVALLLLAAGCDRPAETPKSETPMPVRVLPVTSGNYRPSYEAVAQVKPFRTVDLVARISGFLQERPFREGSFVKKASCFTSSTGKRSRRRTASTPRKPPNSKPKPPYWPPRRNSDRRS